MKYAVIDENRILTEVREYDVVPPHKPGRLLPIVDDVLPSVTDTQKVAASDILIRDEDALQTWQIVDKTAYELRKTWSSMEFLLRFTAEERAELRARALTDVNVADFLQILQQQQQERRLYGGLKC